MGVFYIDCTVVNVRQPKRSVVVPKLLVDTGSEFTWIPESALKQARIAVVKKDMGFVMANGQTITRSTGYAILRAAGFETVDEVVFGRPGDLALLGARTLEGFGATIDPGKKRLVAAGPRPAAAVPAARGQWAGRGHARSHGSSWHKDKRTRGFHAQILAKSTRQQ